MDIFLAVVLHSGPNGFSFLFAYKLSSLARGKDPLEAGWERGLERKVGSHPGGPRMPIGSLEAAEPFSTGMRGRRAGCPHPGEALLQGSGEEGCGTAGAAWMEEGAAREGRKGS